MVAFHDIQHISDRIAREFQPEKIILFGSHAYGTAHEYSDIDMLVVMPFEGHPFDKSMEILDALDPSFTIDLIVRRPDDTMRRYADHDPLIREALNRGRVLYERKS